MTSWAPRLAWTTKGAPAAAILAKASAASWHAADLGRIVARTDDDQVVLEPGLRIHGVAVGHEIDDRVAGVHGDQVRLPLAKGVGNDVLGPHGDDLDLVAVAGGLLENARPGPARIRFRPCRR